MIDKIEKEIDAIKTILTTLQSLDDDVRKNVMEYVLKRLNYENIPVASTQTPIVPGTSLESASTVAEAKVHIKEFKESKQPKTAIEMAVIVAYYLYYIAEKCTDKIATSDLKTWFKTADFPLPSEDLSYTLQNAKNAGYLEFTGHGVYKLNASGYNLVKYKLPRVKNSSSKKPLKKSPAKKNSKASKNSKK